MYWLSTLYRYDMYWQFFLSSFCNFIDINIRCIVPWKKKKNTTFLILYDRYLCQSLRKGVKRKNFYVICYFLSLFVIVGFYGALCKYRKNIKLVNYDWDCALSNVWPCKTSSMKPLCFLFCPVLSPSIQLETLTPGPNKFFHKYWC